MDEITPEPHPEVPTIPTVDNPAVDTTAGTTAADTTADTTANTTAQPVIEPAVAATPEPFAIDEPRTRRFGTPVVGGVIAGVIGLGLGAGVVALASGGDDHHGNDRRMSDQQVQTQNRPGQNQPGQQGGMMPGVQGQQGQQGQQGHGGFMPGRRGDRQGQQGTQGQGGFFPPNGGGQPQGRSGGS